MGSELSWGNPCLFLREIQYCITEVCTFNDSRAQITACQHCSHQKRICQISLIENLHAWKNKFIIFSLLLSNDVMCSDGLMMRSSIQFFTQDEQSHLHNPKSFKSIGNWENLQQAGEINLHIVTHSLSPCENHENCSNLVCDCLAQSNSTSQKDGCNSTHHSIHESVTEICTCITSHIICPIIQ